LILVVNHFACLEARVDGGQIAAYDRLDADAGFEIGAGTQIARSTTLREELRFGARILDDGCVPALGQRLGDAAEE
jgi:hypothetical protein